jgi:hypothetical protein
MPQTPERGGLAARPVPQPDPGILDRILAAMGQKRTTPVPLSGVADPSLPNNVQEAMRLLQAEEPGFDPSIVGPKTALPLVGTFQVPPGAQAAATPFGNIRYDPTQLEGQSAQDVADTLLHEYTHVKQMKPRGVIGQILQMVTEKNLPYGQRPDEIEAWQAERQRRNRMGRTKYDGAPEFSTSNQSTRGDIALYPKPTR